MTSILNWIKVEFPNLKQSFHDGKNELGKQVTNPTYGFGCFEQTYANGEVKTHFQIGVAATSKGISIYLLGIRGKLDLPQLCLGLGKAKVTGYCISFKKFAELDQQILHSVLTKALHCSTHLE
ncbi:MAG: hypothetical protein RL331_486 [Bacteroidota bacterium]